MASAATRILYSRHAGRQLRALLETGRPDIAHLHNIYHQLSPAILPVLAERGVPIVMTLHDLKLACPNYKMRTHGQICERCLGGGYHHAVLRRCVRDSVAASALCAVELFVHRRSPHPTSATWIDSSFRAVSIWRSCAGPVSLGRSWSGFPVFTRVERYEPRFGGDDYFVYVGRLSDEKGVMTLIDAVRGMRRGAVGRHRGGARTGGARAGRQRCGHVSCGRGRPQVWRGSSSSPPEAPRFSVIPSEWYENCPRSCIESFASGTPRDRRRHRWHPGNGQSR